MTSGNLFRLNAVDQIRKSRMSTLDVCTTDTLLPAGSTEWTTWTSRSPSSPSGRSPVSPGTSTRSNDTAGNWKHSANMASASSEKPSPSARMTTRAAFATFGPAGSESSP